MRLAYSTRMSMVCKPDCPDPWRTILDLILVQNREHPDPKHLKSKNRLFIGMILTDAPYISGVLDQDIPNIGLESNPKLHTKGWESRVYRPYSSIFN